MYTTFTDISEKREIEEKLRLNLERLHLAHDAARSGCWEWDLQTNENVWSEELWELYGLEPHSCLPSYDAWLRTVHPDDRETAGRIVAEAAINRKELALEWRVCGQDGSVRWLLARGKPLCDAQGNAVRFIGIILDITARKMAEEELQESKEKLQAVINASPLAIISMDAEGIVTQWNPAAEKIFGWQEAEVIGQCLPVVQEEKMAEHFERRSKVLAGTSTTSAEVRRQRKDGSLVDISISTAPLKNSRGEITGAMGIILDISERKRLEEAQQESEERYRVLVQTSSEVIYRMNPDWREMYHLRGRDFVADTETPSDTWLEKYIHPDDQSQVLLAINDAIRKKSNFDLEHRVRRVDGSYGWIHSRAIPIVDAHGEITHWFGAASDITARKQAEEELRVLLGELERRVQERTVALLDTNTALISELNERKKLEARLVESEEKYRSMVETTSDCLWELDAEGRYTYISPKFEELTGYPPAEFLGRYPHELLTEEEARRVREQFLPIKADTKPFPAHEFQVKHRDGRVVTAEITAIYIMSPEGQFKGMRGVTRDVSERKKLEISLRENEEKYRRVFENELLAICVFDLESLQIVDANQTHVKLYGYSLEELLGGMIALDLTSERDASKASIEQIKNNSAMMVHLRYHKKKDGTLFPVEIFGGPCVLKGHRVMVAMVRDISDRIRMEEAVLKSEEKFRGIFENAVEGIFQSTPEGRYASVNPAFAKMFGFDSPAQMIDEVHNIGAQLYVHSEDRKKILDQVKREGQVIGFETEVHARDGSIFWVAVNAKCFHDAAGNIVSYDGFVTDITERKRVEDALRDSEEKFRSIFENSLDGIFFLPPEGPILAANRAGCAMLGWTEEELFTAGRGSIVDVADPRFAQAYEERKRTGHFQGELTYRRKDGSTFPAEVASSLFFLQNGEQRACNIFRDITERKRADQERQQITKAESLNRMAAAIAHNFNNMLGAVMGHLEIILEDLPEGSGPRQLAMKAMEASERAAAISKLMLIYLGQSVGGAQRLDISRFIKDAYPLFVATLPVDVHLEVVFPPSDLMIMGNPIHLTQVLRNLIVNAVEAIAENEGKIILETTVVNSDEITESRLFPPGWKPAADMYVLVSVSDTGCGIEPEQMERIFDPFFSTKFHGRGLGLSVVPGLLKGFEGAISVESQPGEGATFKLFFPVYEDENLAVAES